MNKFRIPEGVTLTVINGDVETGLRNDPAFYVVGSMDMDTVAIISANGDDLFRVECIGEMNIILPTGERLRYASDLVYVDVKTDKDLENLECEWDNNAWFEIFDEEGCEPLGEICHDVADAIQYALDLAEEIVSPQQKIPASAEVREMMDKEKLADRWMPDYLRCEQCGGGPVYLSDIKNGIGTFICNSCGNVSYEYDLD